MTTLRAPPASSPVTEVENSDSDGYISRAGAAWTMTTSPERSVVTLISILQFQTSALSARSRSICLASSARPLLILDFTVPSAIPSCCGDFLVRQLVDVPQQHRRAQRRRQRPAAPRAAARCGPAVSTRACGLGPGASACTVAASTSRAKTCAIAPAAAIAIDAEIAADADEPGLKVRAAIERAERSEHLQENLLRQIFRFVVGAHEAIRHVEHLAPVRLDDGVPCGLIAFGRALNGGVDGHRQF